MARLLSVNVGLPRDIAWRGKTVHTAVWKEPVQGRRMVRRLNLESDGQGDLQHHGGEHQGSIGRAKSETFPILLLQRLLLQRLATISLVWYVVGWVPAEICKLERSKIMKTSKQLLLGAALLAGTCFAVGPAWSQGDSRLRQGAPVGSPLNPGTSDPAFVKKVQQALKDKGVYSGAIDGKMGPSTMDAIRAFQKKNNLDVTADKALDDQTLRALGIN